MTAIRNIHSLAMTTVRDVSPHSDAGVLSIADVPEILAEPHCRCERIAGPGKFVPLESLADEEFSLVALKQAAGRGRLEAVIGSDGRCRSSRAAVDEYKAATHSRSRHK